MLEAAAELRRVVSDWDAASDTRSAEPVEQRLRDALRQIADAESGIWGWIARDALDDRKATSNGHGDAAPATPGDAIAVRRTGRGSRGDDQPPTARRAAQPARAGGHQRPAAAPGPLSARAARRGRTPRAAGSRAPRAPGARLARGPPRLTQPRLPGAPPRFRHLNARRTMHEPIWVGAPDADPARPSARAARAGGRRPRAARAPSARDRRRPPAAALLPALEAGARPPALGARSCGSPATSPSTPTTRTRGPAATSTPTRSCAATASPPSRRRG